MKKAALLRFGAELTKTMSLFPYTSLVLVGPAIRIKEGATLKEGI